MMGRNVVEAAKIEPPRVDTFPARVMILEILIVFVDAVENCIPFADNVVAFTVEK
jgi:hypothetical protein